jgi:hypothetical protein
MDEQVDGFGATQDSFEHERPIHAGSFFLRPMKRLLVRFRQAG